MNIQTTTDVNRRSIFMATEQADRLAKFLNVMHGSDEYHSVSALDGGHAICRYRANGYTQWVRLIGLAPALDEGWSK